jgi:hypothetical protein
MSTKTKQFLRRVYPIEVELENGCASIGEAKSFQNPGVERLAAVTVRQIPRISGTLDLIVGWFNGCEGPLSGLFFRGSIWCEKLQKDVLVLQTYIDLSCL